MLYYSLENHSRMVSTFWLLGLTIEPELAKLIYCFKIYLFRSQFRLTARELNGLREFNVFIVMIYLKAWYTCQCPISAPQNNISLLKQLEMYKTINESVAKAVLKSFIGHLWYLSEPVVGMAFFDSKVSDDVKVEMVTALDRDGIHQPPRRIELDMMLIPQKSLSDFVTVNTRKLFVALDIPQTFISHHPSTWEQNDIFLRARRQIQKLKVVNDAAERGVALIQSFNSVLTNQEEQKQYLLQVVEKHRQEYPNSKKSTIVGGEMPMN